MSCNKAGFPAQEQSQNTSTILLTFSLQNKECSKTCVLTKCPVVCHSEVLTILDWLDPLLPRLYFILTEICWQLQAQQLPMLSFLIWEARKPSISKSVNWVLFLSSYLLLPFFKRILRVYTGVVPCNTDSKTGMSWFDNGPIPGTHKSC